MSTTETTVMDELRLDQPESGKQGLSAGSARTAGDPSRIVRSEELMQGHREVIILHNDQRYRLVVTRNGKLILQK